MAMVKYPSFVFFIFYCDSNAPQDGEVVVIGERESRT